MGDKIGDPGGELQMAAEDASPRGVDFAHVTKRFVSSTGAVMTAIRDVDLSIKPGEFCAVVGPTGCLKSTTLTLAAGLDRPSAGEVRVSGQPVEGITETRALGCALQHQLDLLADKKGDNLAA